MMGHEADESPVSSCSSDTRSRQRVHEPPRKLSNSRKVHWCPLLEDSNSTVRDLVISPLSSTDEYFHHHCRHHMSTFGSLVSQMAQLFYRHGKFCASHPWEVMVTFFSLAICMFTLGPLMYGDSSLSGVTSSTLSSSSAPQLRSTILTPSGNFVASGGESFHQQQQHQQQQVPPQVRYVKSPPTSGEPRIESAEVTILAISRCLSIFYIYSQLRKLYSIGSKYLVGAAGLFTVFTSFVFISGVFNFLNGNFAVLQKALPFFILLSDFSKVILLSRFALSSSSREEIHENIARGMATLGPGLTLDTLVETLAIGMGTITGYPRLEEISYFSCMTYLVNYLVFMTVFPAALSLTLELAHDRERIGTPVWHIANLGKVLNLETENKPNPVIQRVKVVMSAGLMLVHTLRRWPTIADGVDELPEFQEKMATEMHQTTDNSMASCGMEQILVLGFVLALTIKYIFFENKEAQMDYSKEASVYSFLDKDEKKKLAAKEVDNKDDASTSGISETSASTPSSTRPTTPTAAAEADIDNNRFAKPETPSILITSQDSDTESVIAEYHRKITQSQMMLSSADTSNNSSRAGSVKGMCIHRNHHLTPSSGLGSATDESSIQTGSECEDSEHSQSPSFFIGDDFCSDCYPPTSIEYVDREVQTEIPASPERSCGSALSDEHELQLYPNNIEDEKDDEEVRELSILVDLLRQVDGCKLMNDREVQYLVEKQHIPGYKLESVLGDPQRGVAIRRRVVERSAGRSNVIQGVPYIGYNYGLVNGACCENVIGFLPIPLGIAGPLLLNGREYYVPMATTEGCLVASTNRGCRAVSMSGGLRSTVFADGMTRGPVLHFRSAMDAAAAMAWLSNEDNFNHIKKSFDSTSRFARLKKIEKRVFARYLYLRFCASTGDAMGMNMLSKGTECALEEMAKHVHGLELKCLSGNFCTDKKPSSVNWIQGRGKSVVCETTVPQAIVEKVLKTNVEDLVELNISKNLIGSSVAGSIGGNNAQAANIVAAIYIATGQDPAQTVGSSNCMTVMECHRGDLYISCTMPSIEIGTIGGGTVLSAQSACLSLLGVKGCSPHSPGFNSSELAQIVCGTVLAAELSLLSALAAGHLVRSHMKHNRSNININLEATPAATLSLKH